MVTLSYGKIWGQKVEEIANLKIAKQELKEELRINKEKLFELEKEIIENRKSKENAENNYLELKEKYDATLEKLLQREEETIDLKNHQNLESEKLNNLKSNFSNLQIQLDQLKASLDLSFKLEQDLRCEIKHGDLARNRIEIERDQLRADLEKKCNDFDILAKSKEHCERHIAILLKEKDRIVNKAESKPSLVSKIYQIPLVEEKITS